MKGVTALLVVAMIWAAGLLAFTGRIAQSTPAPEPARADGIVALTGAGSNERIAEAARLLSAGKGRRLLVSGVSRQVSRADIRRISGTVRRLYDCCVDLGFTAYDTVGNGRETAEWARAMRYRSLIVVTADYHMPRAMLEVGSSAPDVTLQPYPVATSVVDARHWWKTSAGARLMVVEYSKYLAILTREAVLGLGPKDPAKAAAKD